jgi:hypothetical protein
MPPGRIISAVMTMVFSWRMRDSYTLHHRGSAEPLTVALCAALCISLLGTGLLLYCHSAARAVYMEVGKLRRIAKGKRQW